MEGESVSRIEESRKMKTRTPVSWGQPRVTAPQGCCCLSRLEGCARTQERNQYQDWLFRLPWGGVDLVRIPGLPAFHELNVSSHCLSHLGALLHILRGPQNCVTFPSAFLSVDFLVGFMGAFLCLQLPALSVCLQASSSCTFLEANRAQEYTSSHQKELQFPPSVTQF